MTKSLVIICSLHASPRSEELLRSLGKFSECSTINFRDVHTGYEIARDIDAVVLGGSKARIVDPSHREMFKTTTDLINHADLPILGICYGHQLLCWSLGAKVSSLREPVKEVFEEVRVLKVDEIFQDFEEGSTIPLAQSHYDYVKRSTLEQVDIALLADSPSCEVEAVKHR